MRLAKNQFTILCDDVRQEVGEKRSLMGIYSNKLILKKLPAFLSKLCLVAFLEDLQKPISNAKARILNPQMEPIETMNVPHLEPVAAGEDLQIVFAFTPFKVEASGDAKIEIYFNDAVKPQIIHSYKIEILK